MYWEQSYKAGATGLVLWGSEPKEPQASEFMAWWKSNLVCSNEGTGLRALPRPFIATVPAKRAANTAASSGRIVAALSAISLATPVAFTASLSESSSLCVFFTSCAAWCWKMRWQDGWRLVVGGRLQLPWDSSHRGDVQ